MTSVKEQVRQVLEKLPDDCSYEDVQYQLYVLETLQRRVEMADRGDFISQEEAEKRMQKWLPK
jgi:hypothetical protein